MGIALGNKGKDELPGILPRNQPAGPRTRLLVAVGIVAVLFACVATAPSMR